jgi:ubiquitin C-terminal hydrolase
MPDWANIYTDTALLERLKAATETPATITYAFIELTKAMWACKTPNVCRPLAFYQKIQEAVKGTIYEDFGRPLPHDGHEYMVYLLDNAHEGLKGPVSKAAAAPPETASSAWKSIWSAGHSPISDMTFGLDQVICKCNTCGHESKRWEHFNMLKIGIPEPGQTLYDAITKEREPIVIADYMCDRCSPNRTSVTITRKFARLPPNLIVVFRRFTETRQKIMAPVNYDGSPISLSHFFMEPTCADDEHRSKQWVYEPYATLDHMGNHIGGHYTCCVRNFTVRESDSNAWCEYDDMRATGCKGPSFGSTTYITVFRRQNLE